MDLSRICLDQFRSYKQGEFVFQASGSLIIGTNGCGKTNLLEAIAYCGIGKSIRFHRDEDLLHYDSKMFRIVADFSTDADSKLKVSLAYADKKKLLKLDDLPIRQLSKLFDVVKVIYCAPEDLLMINGSPRFRRQYFDLAIAQLYPQYIPLLRNYLHLVEQRNALLKRNYQPAEKQSWDESFARSMHDVWSFRARYLLSLNEAFRNQYTSIFPLASSIVVNYNTALKLKLDSSVNSILNHLRDLEPREKLWQRSLAGAHLDDYEFKLSGRDMRVYASQGQKRIAVIILKLIQAHLIETITGIKPILLFDDIFAELDYYHSQSIRDCIDSRYQVFIASPKEDICNIWKGYQVLKIAEK
ncbi:MAG: DNA replication and repair protein RecF [Candidatus Cloacimonetes bacterium]|nr:DNA replication and repair protein RecF [Candidatus Cloacimonadota bacterium]